MDFALNENQAMLKDSAERFLQDRYDFESRRKRLLAQAGTDRSMWSQFAELGWLALLVPEEQGGLGWDMQDAAVILQECGKAMVVEPLLDGAVVAVSLLLHSPSPRALALLGAIASGASIVLPALLEAGGRYDYRAPSTKAVRNGDGFRLSGRKILVTGGDVADHFLISATLEDNVALFAVSAGEVKPGRGSYRQMDGSWAADIDLDDVRVEADALVGAGDALDRALDAGALGVAAQQVGSMDRILEMTSDYLQTRKQFGQPLAAFQALQHSMADLFVNAEMARSALHGGLAGAIQDDGAGRAAISAARVRCNRAALEVGNMGIYLHGGMGMTMEYPVGHHYRRLVQLVRTYGDTEYHFARYEGEMFAAD